MGPNSEDDDEELPTTPDPPTATDASDDSTTNPTFGTSLLPDRTVQLAEPPSPGTARKRTFEEIIQKPQRPIQSTTPLKSPPRSSIPLKASRETHKPSPLKFESQSANKLQPTQSASRSALVPSETLKTEVMDQERNATNRTFAENIASFRQQLEAEFQDYERELEGRDRSQELASLDWAELQERYQKEIGPKVADEQKIMEDFQAHFQQFLLWMKVSGEKESDRAVKRLRTRIAFVEQSESELEKRQDHYTKVLAAFQSAMALLGTV